MLFFWHSHLCSLGRPVHARAFESLTDDGLATAFYDTRADEPSIPPINIVLHPMGITAEVFEFSHGVLPELVLVLFPNRIKHAFDFARPDVTFPVVMLLFPFCAIGNVKNRFGTFPEASVELCAQEFAEFLAFVRGGDIGCRIEITVRLVFRRL